ncbi:hypothetical protein [Bacillus sp. D386]|uniref:hypothetical protein n=1 Tax=Bacillus sp. D386 TaxID=2587155 RepID=UPI00112214AD|nr:hypothetical protein [Bacillus sp. D386]
MDKIYTPSECAKIFGVTVNALKQRAILAEKNGYKINRNEKGHRIYTEKDFSVLYPKKKVDKVISENISHSLDNLDINDTIRISKKALENEMVVIEETIKNLEDVIARKKEEVKENIIKREKTAEMLKSIDIYLG